MTRSRLATERQRHLERELAQERLLLKAVVEQLPVGVVIAEVPSGKIVLTNAAISQLVGEPVHHAESSRDDASYGGVRPDGRPLDERDYPIAQTIQTGQSVSQEGSVRRRDGSLRTVHLETRLVQDPAGETIACVGTCIDLTARKESEASLRASEERFRLMADTVPNMILLHRCRRHVHLPEQKVLRVHGDGARHAGRGDTSGADSPGRRPPEHDPRTRRSTNRPTVGNRLRLRRADGTYRWFLGRSYPVRDAGQNIVGWNGSATDIDDDVRADAAAREADERKNEFLAMLAHELRNPLAPIRNSLELMRLASPHGALERNGATIERQLGHLTRLVDDLLDVSRISLGKIELRRECLDLREIVAQAVETSRPLIDERRHRLCLQVASRPAVRAG